MGDLTIEKKKVSVDGEELIYELEVTSSEGTKGPVTITDEMSDGLTFVEGMGVWRGNGASVSNAAFRPASDRSGFTLSLPEMAAGASYVVRYRCRADVDLLDTDMTVRNSATVTGKEKLHGAKVKANDLRAGAALIIAGLAAEGVTTLENIHYVERGYERLIEKMTALGANIKRIED